MRGFETRLTKAFRGNPMGTSVQFKRLDIEQRNVGVELRARMEALEGRVAEIEVRVPSELPPNLTAYTTGNTRQ